MTWQMMLRCLALIVAGGSAAADALVASHTIRSRSVLTAEDLQLLPDDMPGALTDPAEAIGMEARVVLYAGRPVRAEDLVAPALIERNQIVPLVFVRGRLAIATDGRSLARAALGDRVRVMNLESRTTVIGTVDTQGRVIVGPDDSNLTALETLR